MCAVCIVVCVVFCECVLCAVRRAFGFARVWVCPCGVLSPVLELAASSHGVVGGWLGRGHAGRVRETIMKPDKQLALKHVWRLCG